MPELTAHIAGALRPWLSGGRLDRHQLRRARPWLILGGILALIAEVVAIAVPVIASVTTALFIGWVLVMGGITMGEHAIGHRVPLRLL